MTASGPLRPLPTGGYVVPGGDGPLSALADGAENEDATQTPDPATSPPPDRG